MRGQKQARRGCGESENVYIPGAFAVVWGKQLMGKQQNFCLRQKVSLPLQHPTVDPPQFCTEATALDLWLHVLL